MKKKKKSKKWEFIGQCIDMSLAWTKEAKKKKGKRRGKKRSGPLGDISKDGRIILTCVFQ
jgi:hypothetical protein